MSERKIILHIAENGDMDMEVVGSFTLIEHIGIHKFYCDLFTNQMLGNNHPEKPDSSFKIDDFDGNDALKLEE